MLKLVYRQNYGMKKARRICLFLISLLQVGDSYHLSMCMYCRYNEHRDLWICVKQMLDDNIPLIRAADQMSLVMLFFKLIIGSALTV